MACRPICFILHHSRKTVIFCFWIRIEVILDPLERRLRALQLFSHNICNSVVHVKYGTEVAIPVISSVLHRSAALQKVHHKFSIADRDNSSYIEQLVPNSTIFLLVAFPNSIIIHIKSRFEVALPATSIVN